MSDLVCSVCDKTVDKIRLINGKSYCMDCNEHCTTCGYIKIVGETCKYCFSCQKCGNSVLKNKCNKLGDKYLCRDCSYICRGCNKVLMKGETCEECKEVCCVICGKVDSTNEKYNNKRYCTGCIGKKVVNSYAYIPKKLAFYKTNQKPNNKNLFLGLELEFATSDDKYSDGSVEYNKVIKDVYDIMGVDKNSRTGIIKYDGSVTDGTDKQGKSYRAGFEVVSNPMTYKYHAKFPWKDLLAYLADRGFVTDNTCGLHVNCNKNFFGNMISRNIAKVLYICERYKKEMYILSGRDNERWNSRYAGYYGFSSSSIDGIRGSLENIKFDKYRHISIRKDSVIEFRMFQSTTIYNELISRIQFVDSLMKLVSKTTSETITEMSWFDIIKKISIKKELKHYMAEKFPDIFKDIIQPKELYPSNSIDSKTIQNL